MGFQLTVAVAAGFAAFAALFGWLGARLPDPRRGPRLVPWRFLMVTCAAGVMLMLVHLANLFGMKTGDDLHLPPPGRR